MGRIFVVAGIAAIWGGLFWGSLAVAKTDLGQWSGLCGAWGCLPPAGPLLSVHLMWMVLIGGASWLSHLAVPILKTSKPWLGMLGASLLATLILVGWKTVDYAISVGDTQQLPKIAAYHLVKWTDLPLMQITLACFVNWVSTRWFHGRSLPAEVNPEPPNELGTVTPS